VDAQPEPGASHGDDEVARRRRMRQVALSGRPVPGSATLTLGELAEEAQAASSAGAGAEGVQRFLAERGHSPATIAAVLSCLDLVASDAVGGTGAVFPMPEASARRQRLRTLAQLEAMLLEE
jgi:hypothetical protein